jgi:hypothetical protein
MSVESPLPVISPASSVGPSGPGKLTALHNHSHCHHCQPGPHTARKKIRRSPYLVISRMAHSPTFISRTASSQPCTGPSHQLCPRPSQRTINTSDEIPYPDLGDKVPPFRGAVKPIKTVSGRPSTNMRRGTCSCPMLPGWDVSLSQPVYSMVTNCPLVGRAPVPETWMVLVTPMVVERVSHTAKLCRDCQGRGLPGWGEELCNKERAQVTRGLGDGLRHSSRPLYSRTRAGHCIISPTSWGAKVSTGNKNRPPDHPHHLPSFPLVVTPVPRDGHAPGPSTRTHQSV